VLADGLPVRSCQVELGAIGAREITTLEGIGTPDRLHKLQRAFIAEQAAQCGYCTSGMILEAKALLDRTQEPTEPEIREQLAQHLCRCGTHNRIVAAVQRAIREG
jgi:nicotinate dehydrogenase subunit A